MALASLCRDATKKNSWMAPLFALPGYPDPIEVSFTAFIVNHTLRENSGTEAVQVAAELKKLDIDSEILDLDWAQHGDPSSLGNFESAARRLRYQALGMACYERSISSLLVAHHNDDQVETVMVRILTNYLGAGLGAMRAHVPIPECTGIYGVDHSGNFKKSDPSPRKTDHIAIEQGGVNVHRPLLPFSKQQLIEVCQHNGVRWFEDRTNADRQLTLRNTVRYLQASNVLPAAFQSNRLSSLATKVAKSRRELERLANDFLADMRVQLDVRTGMACIRLPLSSRLSSTAESSSHIYALRKMIELVTPKADIVLSRINSGVDYVFRTHGTDAEDCPMDAGRPDIQMAGVSFHRQAAEGSEAGKAAVLILRRASPTAMERQALQLSLWSPSSAAAERMRNRSNPMQNPLWHLWDCRYWIRILPPKVPSTVYGDVFVRFLDPGDLASMRKSESAGGHHELEIALSHARGSLRFTLPAVVARKVSPEDGYTLESVVALPSLNWSVDGWSRHNSNSTGSSWHWDIRYKHVQFHSNRGHNETR